MDWEAISIGASHAQNDYLDAQLASDQAIKSRQDALDKIALSKSKLAEQQQILNQLTAALDIKASASGFFEQHVGVGSFVKKGHLLGRILV